MPRENDNTPIEAAAEHTAEAIERTEEAVTEAVEEVVDAVAEPVAGHSEDAAEAATAAAEAIEEEVEAVVEAHPDLPPEQMERVYEEVINRLRNEGHIGSPAIVQEIAGEAEEVGEVALDAPEMIVEPVTEAARDTISPRREHWYTKPRKFMGRTW
jgi:hypothetical protein